MNTDIKNKNSKAKAQLRGELVGSSQIVSHLNMRIIVLCHAVFSNQYLGVDDLLFSKQLTSVNFYFNSVLEVYKDIQYILLQCQQGHS